MNYIWTHQSKYLIFTIIILKVVHESCVIYFGFSRYIPRVIMKTNYSKYLMVLKDRSLTIMFFPYTRIIDRTSNDLLKRFEFVINWTNHTSVMNN